MTENRFLLHLFDKNYILKTFYVLLSLSLLVIFDFYIAYKLSSFISGFLLLFLLSISGFIGLIAGFIRVKYMLKNIIDNVDKGVFSMKSLYAYFGSIMACVLLIIPGFFTDLLGIIVFASWFKSGLGRLVLRSSEEKIKSVYEYLKL